MKPLRANRRDERDAEMAEEMRLHLEARERENVAAGMSPEEAHYAALRRFGGVEQVKERCRDQRDAWFDRGVRVPLQLLRHGFNSLRRSPLLALTIVLTLGVALSACVVVFAFLNTFLLRPLPFGDASRLVVVQEYSLKSGRANAIALTYDNLVAIEEHSKIFSRLGIYRIDQAQVHNGEAAEPTLLQRVSADVFPLMGARAALGAVISAENAELDGVRAMVLADSTWRRRFGADPAVLGRICRVGDRPYRVVGVMPPEFSTWYTGTSPDAWLALLPQDYRPNEHTPQRQHIRHMLWAELAPGVSPGEVNAQLDVLAAALRAKFPGTNADRGFFAVPVRDYLLGNFGQQLLLLQGAVLLVLVVACFNCLCLLIARALQRRREFAVRLALGASRRHLLAQLFAESLWLSLPAAGLALLLANIALPLGVSLLPAVVQPGLASGWKPSVDATAVVVMVATAVMIALGFSALPLLQTRRLNLETALREGGRSIGSRPARRATHALAVGQIAMALALLICAALLVRSQYALQRLDIGLPTAELDLFHVGLRGDSYTRDPARRVQFFERFREQLLTLPGVREVGVASFFMMPPPSGYSAFVQEGDGLEISDTPKRALLCSMLPATMSALSLRLMDGRWLSETDRVGHPPVAVVSASLAARHWPGQSPIGKRVRMQSLHGTPYAESWVEVVGVIGDIYGMGNQPRVVDAFYMTIAQAQPPGLGMGFYIRHAGRPPNETALKRALAQIDPTLQIFGHASPAELHARSSWQLRFMTQLVTTFASLAVVLALAGIYAVNAFFVAHRLSEFGIRAALGASRRNLLALVLGDGLRLTGYGLAVGAVLAFAASRSLGGLLFSVPLFDPLIYIGAMLLMALACGAATLVPARRAAGVDPATALRAE